MLYLNFALKLDENSAIGYFLAGGELVQESRASVAPRSNVEELQPHSDSFQPATFVETRFR